MKLTIKKYIKIKYGVKIYGCTFQKRKKTLLLNIPSKFQFSIIQSNK